MNKNSIHKLSDNDNPLLATSNISEYNSAELLQYKKLLQILLVSCIAPNNNKSVSSSNSPSGKSSMMPLAPTMTELPAAHKPKIGFSIDSIVGGGGGGRNKEEEGNSIPSKSQHNNHHHERSRRTSSSADNNTSDSRSPTQTPPEERCSPDTPENRGLGMSPLLAHLPKHHPHHHPFLHHHLLNNSEEKNGSLSPPMPPGVHPHLSHHHLLHPLHHQLRLPSLHQHHHQLPPSHHHPSRSPGQSPGTRLSPSPTNNNKSNDNDDNNARRSINNSSKDQDQVTSSRSPSPQSRDSPRHDGPSQSPEIHPPIQPPPGALGIPRPGFPPHMGGPHPPGMPPQFATYPPGMINFAALAAASAAQQGHHPGFPGFMPGHPGGPHPHPAAAAHPLYPWLLAKQSRLFPHRFGPGPADLPGFLFQPFRKPKRIRTAFSPSQLLKLEHAFEKNHYVVGAERKQLAKSLSLSETQVKVWFQNRRTKHKRVEQEDETMGKKPDGSRGHNNSGSDPSSGSNNSNSAISADSSTRNYSEEMSDDEEIVMDDDYSEEEEMEQHGHHNNMHHLSQSYS